MSTANAESFARPADEGVDYVRRTSILVFLMTFLFIYMTTTASITSHSSAYYFLLFVALLGVIGLHERNLPEINAHTEILPREHFRISSLPMQVIGGFLLLLVYMIPVVLIGSIKALGPISLDGFFRTLFLQIVVIGMVEALLLIVYVRVVFKGIFVFPFIFAFLHPQVGPLWMQGIVTNESILFFFSAVLFGFVFIGIFLARDVLKPAQIRDEETNELITIGRGNAYKLFGAVSMAVFHGGINTISIIASANIGGIGI